LERMPRRKEGAAARPGELDIIHKEGVMPLEDREILKGRILRVLTSHVGREKAVGMGELYERVFHQAYQHRINSTRALRVLITELREEGVAIASTASMSGGGYYLLAAGSELVEYLDREKARALRILGRVATMKKVALPDLLNQMHLSMLGDAR